MNYLMRAWNNVSLTHVYWVSSGAPDFTGSSSPYPIIEIEDAVVMKVIATEGSGGGGPIVEEMLDSTTTLEGYVDTNYLSAHAGSIDGGTLESASDTFFFGDLGDLMAEHP